MTGTLYDTYVAALQHDTTDVPREAAMVGVVRRPTPWFYAQVDENVPALAPPPDLLDDAKECQADLVADGLDDAAAHNKAMDDVDFEARYLDYLESSEAAEDATTDLRARLDRGEDVALVCFENTEHKRCHRTMLRTYVEGTRSA